MEYPIARSMEVCRLDLGQLYQLQEREKILGRCLMPHEIQDKFNLIPLKVCYEIPERDPAQAEHTQRLRNDFYQHRLFPAFKFVEADRVDLVHEFDNKVRALVVDEMKFELRYTGAERKTRLKDAVKALTLALMVVGIR